MTLQASVAEPGLADLHRHLDGSLRPRTLAEFAGLDGVELPPDLCFFAGMGLDEALARFAFTLGRLHAPERVARVASEICEDAKAQEVTTLEIRFGPQLHPGSDPARYVDAALEGIGGRAGLILCALYGEDPSSVEALVDIGAARPGVVGLDLAGGPLPSHRWRLADYGPVFQRARALGLGTTVHAAEGRPAEEIRVAIEALGARRIGHGTTLLDDPSIVDLVGERGVCIEACVSSNVHVGAIPEVEAHPIAHWLEKGLKVCICTDNTLLSDVDSVEEYRRVAAIPGMSPLLMAQATQAGHGAAFGRPN